MKRRTLLDRILLMFALAGCLSLASCKKKMPSEVIKPAEMENILYDYHLAQALGSEYNGEERYKRELLLQYVFEKHHVTKAEFDSSMVWYTRNMEELGNIYKNLERRYDEANKNLAQLYQTRKKGGVASGDTVSLWNEREMYVLTAAPLTNKLTFEMETDTTFHPLDRFVWQMNVSKLVKSDSKLYAGLTVRYRNDSTHSVVRLLAGEGMQQLTVKADTLPMKSLQGFVFYKDSVTSEPVPVVLQDIALTRYHAPARELEALRKANERQAAKKDSLEAKKPTTRKDSIQARDTVPESQRTVRRRSSPQELRRQQRTDK